MTSWFQISYTLYLSRTGNFRIQTFLAFPGYLEDFRFRSTEMDVCMVMVFMMSTIFSTTMNFFPVLSLKKSFQLFMFYDANSQSEVKFFSLASIFCVTGEIPCK